MPGVLVTYKGNVFTVNKSRYLIDSQYAIDDASRELFGATVQYSHGKIKKLTPAVERTLQENVEIAERDLMAILKQQRDFLKKVPPEAGNSWSYAALTMGMAGAGILHGINSRTLFEMQRGPTSSSRQLEHDYPLFDVQYDFFKGAVRLNGQSNQLDSPLTVKETASRLFSVARAHASSVAAHSLFGLDSATLKSGIDLIENHVRETIQALLPVTPLFNESPSGTVAAMLLTAAGLGSAAGINLRIQSGLLHR